MNKLYRNESGFMHAALMIAITVLVFGTISFAGYRTYQAYHEVKTVAYEGTLTKENCSATTPSCTGYSLTTNDNKTYNLVLPSSSSSPSPPNKIKVTVMGTTPSSGSGQSTISVAKIQPVSAAPAAIPTASPTTSPSTIAPEPRPYVSYTGTLYFFGEASCAYGATCTNTWLKVSDSQSFGLLIGNSGAQFVNNENATVTGNPDQKNPYYIDVISITPVK